MNLNCYFIYFFVHKSGTKNCTSYICILMRIKFWEKTRANQFEVSIFLLFLSFLQNLKFSGVHSHELNCYRYRLYIESSNYAKCKLHGFIDTRDAKKHRKKNFFLNAETKYFAFYFHLLASFSIIFFHFTHSFLPLFFICLNSSREQTFSFPINICLHMGIHLRLV